LTTNIHDLSGYVGGAAQIPQANAINDMSHLNLITNIHNSSGHAGGAAQILQANAINDKSCPNSTTNIHSSSGYAGGASQIPQANDINDKSCPNLTTNTHSSSGYAGGAAQIPQANDINDRSHPNLTTSYSLAILINGTFFADTSDCQYVMGFPVCILNNFLLIFPISCHLLMSERDSPIFEKLFFPKIWIPLYLYFSVSLSNLVCYNLP
jgi:hypothetical protein